MTSLSTEAAGSFHSPMPDSSPVRAGTGQLPYLSGFFASYSKLWVSIGFHRFLFDVSFPNKTINLSRKHRQPISCTIGVHGRLTFNNNQIGATYSSRSEPATRSRPILAWGTQKPFSIPTTSWQEAKGLHLARDLHGISVRRVLAGG